MSERPRIPRNTFGAPRRAEYDGVVRSAVDLHVRLPDWLAAPLYAKSQQTRTPMSSIMRRALSEHLGVAEPVEEGDALE